MSSPRVIITVTGHAARDYAPNRCAVHLTAAADGPSRAAAAEPVARAAEALTALLAGYERQDGAPVRRWHLDQTQHSRRRPYSQDGAVLPWLHESSAQLLVLFRGSSAVARFVDEAAQIEGVEVDRLEWRLTRTAEAKALARVRKLAIRNAEAKARASAATLGLGEIRPIALADPGMLGVAANQPGPPPGRARMMMASDSAGAPGPASLRPEPLPITVDVDARFEAT